MKRTLPIIALALMSLLAAAPASCPRKSGNLADKDLGPTKQVFDKKHRVSISVPVEWDVILKDGNPALFAIAPGGETYGPMANLVIERLAQRMDPFDYLQANVISMKATISGLEFIQGGMELKDETRMAWIHYTFPRQSEPMEAIAYCQTKDYDAYVLTAMCPKKDFKKYEPLFRTLGRSMKIVETD